LTRSRSARRRTWIKLDSSREREGLETLAEGGLHLVEFTTGHEVEG
jgi:hypothetical protein